MSRAVFLLVLVFSLGVLIGHFLTGYELVRR